ncbi:hypothetical protein QBE55_08120 [Eubacteriales bacterium mix99]
MDKFAVVLQPDEGEGILASHPVLKYLPEKYARCCLSRLPARTAGFILDREDNDRLGCMVKVPALFLQPERGKDGSRLHLLKGMARKMKKRGIHYLSFPFAYDFLDPEEIFCLEDRGIAVLDGFYPLLAGLLLVWKELLIILEKELPFFEVGIWGADTDIGRIWVEFMVGVVNHMCLGGQDRKVLEETGREVLNTTGLSCRITQDPDTCLSDKQLTVLAEPVPVPYTICQPSFHFLSCPESSFPVSQQDGVPYESPGVYWIEMGWMALPRDIVMEKELCPWDELGILEGLITISSKIYRNDIRSSRFSLRQIERIQQLYERYPVKLQGFVQNGRKIHFNRFRKEYFSRNNEDIS